MLQTSKIGLAQHIFFSAFICLALNNVAAADVIHFNALGQSKYKRTKLFGVVRKADHDGIKFQYFLGKTGWRWPAAKTMPVIEAKFIARIENYTDTKKDFSELIKGINSRLRGQSRDGDVSQLARAAVFAQTRVTFYKKYGEPDPGTAEFAMKQLKTIIGFGRKFRSNNAKTEAMSRFGVAARDAVVGLIKGGAFAMRRPQNKVEVGDIDPRLVASVAVDLVPDVTWNLDYGERDYRSLFGPVTMALFDLIAYRGPYQTHSYPQSMTAESQSLARRIDSLLFRKCWWTLESLCKKSDTPVKALIGEFSRNATHSSDSEAEVQHKLFRKQMAAILVAVAGSDNPEYTQIGVEALFDIIHSRPVGQPTQSADGVTVLKPKQYELTSLYMIMSRSSHARSLIGQKISELQGVVAEKKESEADKRLLRNLDLLVKYHSRQASSN